MANAKRQQQCSHKEIVCIMVGDNRHRMQRNSGQEPTATVPVFTGTALCAGRSARHPPTNLADFSQHGLLRNTNLNVIYSSHES